jgi:hypothetical protein
MGKEGRLREGRKGSESRKGKEWEFIGDFEVGWDLVQHRGEAQRRYTLFNKVMLTICFHFHNLLSFSERES